MVTILYALLMQITNSQSVQKIDIGEINLPDPNKITKISSVFPNVFLIGKFGGFPIFELSHKLNSWVTNCEFCEMEDWNLEKPEILVFPDKWKNSTFFVSALVFNDTIRYIPDNKLQVEMVDYPYCPNQCNRNGECDDICQCFNTNSGYDCNVPVCSLSYDKKKTGVISAFSWKFFLLNLKNMKAFVRVNFDNPVSTGLYVYLGSSKNSNHFPSMANSKYEISFPIREEMISNYDIDKEYLLLSFFCAQAQNCDYSMNIEVRQHGKKLFFLKVLGLSTLLIASFILVCYYTIKLGKKLKSKCKVLEDEKRLIKFSEIEACFPKHKKNKRSLKIEKCCICLSEFEDKDILRTLGCIHSFHSYCIDQWTAESGKCPLCKRSIFLSSSRD